MTTLFEEAYDTIAAFIGAPGRASIAIFRNATEAINAVMYSLLTEFRDGDNVVTTLMERRSYVLVDAAQLATGSYLDVQAMDADFLAFSCHKLLAPFGTGVLYARERLLAGGLPFLYGGDMIAEGKVFPDSVEYGPLPWKYAAGTPNILGTITSAQALRLLVDLALSPREPVYYAWTKAVDRLAVRAAMDRVKAWNTRLTARALDGLEAIDGITVYGPRDPARRTALVAFNLAGRDPVSVAEALNYAGVESRAGCHCATLAHHPLGLTPPASCRISFALYNTMDDVDRAVAAVADAAAGRVPSRQRAVVA
jgi:cysteine desulfurase/selenocysteine lyase